LKSLESDTARDVFQQKTMIINTGRSWAAIADSYAKIVDQRMESEFLDEIVKEILSEPTVRNPESIEGKVTQLVQWIRQNIRYTGVVLGSAAIVPARSSTILGRRFGDCKDQSALLVGMLRATGIDAHVALVNVDTIRFPMPAIPCLNTFNHAIVVIRNPSGDLWIDPTNMGSTVHSIPGRLQGRYALIASPDSQDLTVVPNQGIEANRKHTDQNIQMNIDGTGTVRLDFSTSGFFATTQRAESFGSKLEDVQKQMEDYYSKIGSTIQPKVTYRADPQSEDPIFKYSIELRDVQLDRIDSRRLRYDVDFSEAVEVCPLFHLAGTDEQGIPRTRKYPSENLVSYRWSCTTKIAPPTGFRVTTKFQDHSIEIGIVSLKAKSTQLPDGAFQIEQVLDVQPGKLSAEDIMRLADLGMKIADENHPMFFSAIAEFANSNGDIAKSAMLEQLNQSREQWRLSPNAETAYKYISALVAIAQVEEAREFAQKVIQQYPDMGLAHAGYAFALLHDITGRELGFGVQIRKAEQECRKAIELSPENWQSYYLLALLINIDENRCTINNTDSASRQIAVFEEAEKRGVKNETLTVAKINSLFLLNRFDESVQLANASGLEFYAIVGRVLKAAKASRWADIASLRDRIQNPRERATIGSLAEQFLMAQQDYQTALRVSAVMQGISDQAFEERLKTRLTLKAIERPENPNASPESVAREYLYRILSQGDHSEDWSDIVANPQRDCIFTDQLAMITSVLRNSLTSVRASAVRRFDTTSVFPIKIEGDDATGYVARYKSDLEVQIAVIQQDGKYKVLLTGPFLRDYALKALEFLEANNLDGAIHWMDLAVSKFVAGNVLNPHLGNPIKSYWSASRNKSAETIRTAIEMLLASSEWTPERSQYLRQAAKAEKSIIKRQWILASLFDNKDIQPNDLEYELTNILEQFPDHPIAKYRWTILQASKGNLKYVADQIAEINNPKDPIRASYEDLLDFHQRNFAALSARRIQIASNSSVIDDWNSCIWAGIFNNEVKEDWLENCRKLLQTTPEPKALHSLACAEAHHGEIDQAIFHLHRLIESHADQIEDIDYWILGRIAEHCQLPNRARSYYERIKYNPSPRSSYELAKIRLEGLDEQPAEN
jgi:tetratricopeptide (TPR) repeat protein